MKNHINDLAWLREAYESGKTLGEISEELGVSRNTIRNRFIRFGIDRRSTGSYHKGKPKSPETKAMMSEARRLYWKGHPDRDEFRLKISGSRRRTGVSVKGYRWVYVLGRGKVLEHRLVMEWLLGRKLATHECVHHKDGDKLNNLPENLQLVSNSEHIQIHHRQGDIPRPSPSRPTWAAFATPTHKECRRCRLLKPRDEFSPKRGQGGDPHASQCKKCCAATVAERRKLKAST